MMNLENYQGVSEKSHTPETYFIKNSYINEQNNQETEALEKKYNKLVLDYSNDTII